MVSQPVGCDTRLRHGFPKGLQVSEPRLRMSALRTGSSLRHDGHRGVPILVGDVVSLGLVPVQDERTSRYDVVDPRTPALLPQRPQPGCARRSAIRLTFSIPSRI